jgi:hypothetical protein
VPHAGMLCDSLHARGLVPLQVPRVQERALSGVPQLLPLRRELLKVSALGGQL